MVALIAGPTAAGKTALALSLAQQRDSIIINADSAQVYADLPILSAQPSPAEIAQVPHRLFGYLEASEAGSAARWAAAAKAAIGEAHQAARMPILVGGTGLYLRTLLDGIAPVPEIDPEIRLSVRALETADAHAALLREDPKLAASLHPADGSRIKRALEVIRSSGRSIADWRGQKTGGIGAQIHLKPLLLLPPRSWLYARCDVRFAAMMDQGAVEEVRALLAKGYPPDAPVMRAIGVAEISAMLKGAIDRETAVAHGQTATRQYAKRQYTWFRNQSPESWPRWEKEINDNLLDKIKTLFQ